MTPQHEPTELLFSYGTLRHRDVQLATLRSGREAWVQVFADG